MLGRREALALRPDLAGIWDAVDALFPVRITRSFAERADLADPDDPLARQVMPDAHELDADGLDDPVGEKGRVEVPWVVRKYRDRALLLVTKRCHLYCRYCFRRTHAPGEHLDPTPAELEAALAWLASQEELREVILSGGDPLVLPDDRLLAIIDAVRALGLRVRIHTRAPITHPSRVTSELADALAERAVWVVVHCNHPRELAPDVDAALARFVNRGVPVLDQAVLLRGVNDDPDVLVELFEALVRRRVRPYYLHHTDAVEGNAHFRVPVAEGLALMAEVRRRVGGLAVPRYVVDPPDGSGKRDVSAELDAV
ncbi:MAG: KamA family radical SAM protein [Myxococcota bacterium]